MREATLLAVGAVAEPVLEVQAQQDHPPLDVPALLHNVLHQDLLTPNMPPFLTGRALWMAARWVHPNSTHVAQCPVHEWRPVTGKQS